MDANRNLVQEFRGIETQTYQMIDIIASTAKINSVEVLLILNKIMNKKAEILVTIKRRKFVIFYLKILPQQETEKYSCITFLER